MNKKTNFARYANKLEALDKLNQYDELLNAVSYTHLTLPTIYSV